jgi:hypothetical protein
LFPLNIPAVFICKQASVRQTSLRISSWRSKVNDPSAQALGCSSIAWQDSATGFGLSNGLAGSNPAMMREYSALRRVQQVRGA